MKFNDMKKNVKTNLTNETLNSSKNQFETEKTNNSEYSYYSKMLGKPFDTLEELRWAEQSELYKLQLKREKADQKKAEATKVEDAFKKLNAARKAFKTELEILTGTYREDLTQLKNNFESDKAKIYEALAEAEKSYKAALKAFTEKYPEGYHLTLKDGDFETTISSGRTVSDDNYRWTDLFNLLFSF